MTREVINRTKANPDSYPCEKKFRNPFIESSSSKAAVIHKQNKNKNIL
jgi:hypothetical protein